MQGEVALIFVYVAFALIVAGLLVFVVTNDWRKRMTPSIFFMLGSFFIWYVSLIVFYASHDPVTTFFMYDISMPFIELAALGALLFVLDYFGLDAYKPAHVVAVLCSVPILTFILLLTIRHHEFIRVGLEVVSIEPVHALSGERGPWYWVHCIYCYGMLAAASATGLVQYRYAPELYRSSGKYLVAGVIVAGGFTALHISGLLQTNLNIGLLGSTICVALGYRSTRQYQGTNLLNYAKADIFNEIEDAILVMDLDGVIINRNLAAKYLLHRLGCAVDEPNYETIIHDVIERVALRGHKLDGFVGIDYTLMEHGQEREYNLYETKLYDNRGIPLGFRAIIKDVTDVRAAARALENTAGRDALTGMLNRRSFEREVSALEDNELSLSVIACHFQGLRGVNTRYGREQGDTALRLIANAIISCCPPRAFAARTSGDEYHILIVNCDEQQAYAIAEDIIERTYNHVVGHCESKLIMGIATRTNRELMIEDIISTADQQVLEERLRYVEASEPDSGT